MVIDWVLMRRLAWELEAVLRGAKVRDAGLLPDGRIALLLRSRGAQRLLAVDAFAAPPVVTLEDGELGIAPEPGFVRALANALRGMALVAVRARRGERLLRLSFATRSRFGVADELELYLELIPRFGNLILTKRGTVVAAAKEFSLAQNGTRAVEVGLAYEPPPPRPGALLPPAYAEAGVAEAALAALVQGGEAMREPLYAYRRDGALLAAAIVPLPQLRDAVETREAALLELVREMRDDRVGRGERERTGQRRRRMLKRLDERAHKLDDELRALEARRGRAAEREVLRAQGEGIYAALHELPEPDRGAAKDRAAELFAAYKKHGAALPHIERRERVARAALQAVEALRWEVERTADEDLDDVDVALGALDHRRKPHPPAPPRRRKRAPLEYRTPSGSRILVGRSPTENADVTFRIARPNDLWFHAQGVPGAHVVLSRDDRAAPPEDDVRSAAALAALHSKANGSARVPIDYTLRKHVRKQQDAPPGLVWYTQSKSIAVEPRAPAQGSCDRSGEHPRIKR